jgi:PAS domain S-box-containing protein
MKNSEKVSLMARSPKSTPAANTPPAANGQDSVVQVRDLVARLPVIIQVKDARGRFILVNKLYEDFSGRTEAELLGLTPYDLFPPELAARLLAEDRRILASGQAESFEEVIPRQGVARTFLTTKFPVIDQAGRIAGVCGVSLDITQHRAAAAAVRESEAKYRQLFELSADALFLVERETGAILEANAAASAMYGYSREEFQKLTNIELSAQPEETRRINLLGQTHVPLRWHRRKDGTVFPVEIAVANMILDGRAVGMGVIRDITERLGSQEALAKSRAELEKRVCERTAELSEAIARLNREVEERRRAQGLLEVQRDLGYALSCADSLSQAMRACLSAALTIPGMDSGGIYLAQPEGGFRMAHHRGLSAAFVEAVRVTAPDSYHSQLVKAGVPHYGAYDQFPLTNVDRRRKAEGLKSLAVVPFLHEGRVIGSLNVASHTEETIGAGARAMLEAVAAQAGGVLARLSAEDSLRKVSQEKESYRLTLEAIFQSVPDAILTVDQELSVVEVNKAFEDFCQVSRANLVGEQLDALKLSCSGACLESLRETVRSGRRMREYRARCGRPEREGRVLVLSTAPFMNRAGAPVGAVLTITDITRLTELEARLSGQHSFHKIIGKSRRMAEIFVVLQEVAGLESTILLCGESGTGKELMVDAIHAESPRAGKPLIKVNCAALTESILESELFGHVRGAFTGAVRDKVGRFQAAEGGTIFLDEIGEISPRIQLKLLRFLDQREFERVGDARTAKADVRVVAATNVDLSERVRQGFFREDLYYRLKVMVLHLPPLRERKEDIPLLVEHFLAQFRKSLKKDVQGVSTEAMELLLAYAWPGNVRELKHCLEHGCILSPGGLIMPGHLPAELREGALAVQPLSPAGAAMGADAERARLLAALEAARWNKTRAADLLGMSRKTLYRRLETLGIN